MELIYIILIFCIPVYFICRWVMKKRKVGNSKIRWLTALIPTAIITPILVCGSIFLILIFMAYTPDKNFTKNKWDTEIDKRYQLSHKLIKNKTLIGKTHDELLELLGNENVNITQNDSIFRISYFLGTRRSLMTANWYYLDVYIQGNRVVEVNQTEDNGKRKSEFTK